TTGFTMNAEAMAETMQGNTIQWMTQKAQNLQAVIVGSIIIQENGQFFNRLIWMTPSGKYQFYDKRHLFTLANEHLSYSPGNRKLIITYKGWKICPLVCYDLRFPAWSRNLEDYDLLIYIANWPTSRAAHWNALLRARAIENQCYLAAVNRIGVDQKNNHYTGDSSIIDYNGSILYKAAQIENAFTTKLSYEALLAFRKKLNFLPDRDNFSIT
ncbi:MAG TPA: amidohydrolase, partial [Phaeodactylibacter sp.]|nr:amidohydrolase [Phaeodactylibacter sp.]